MTTKIPSHAQIVVIGGGVVGASTAYHLTTLGCRDVVMLEQGALSCGTTWHAAGLVGQLRTHKNITRLSQYSTELYAQLEQETGLATGWKRCGSITVARSHTRLVQLRRAAATASAFGVEVEVMTPTEASKLWPIMRTDDLVGAVWLPGDGKVNPTDLTQALAKGMRNHGGRIFEKVKVTAIHVQDGAVSGLSTTAGDIRCEIVVNCAGQWAKQVGRMCGVTVPLHSAEHMYIVTKEIDGVQRDLPVMRDPDGYVYFKEEVGGLVVGGFEPNAKPWGMNGIPDPFEFQLLPDDWEQFQILMENALIRVPILESVEIKQFYNGPESFTPDGNFILGEAPEVRNFFVGAGFNSMGIAGAGGAGKALAEWIISGEPTLDLWPVDIRRFARFHGNDTWLKDRVKEALGLHYAMPWPNRELETARPLRRSPIYHLLKERGACFGSKMGWERPNWFDGNVIEPKVDYSYGKPNWFERSAAEHWAARNGVAIFDMTSFSKYLVKGHDAETVLQYLCTNDVAVPVGKVVYTGMLNDRGTYESDFTVTRLAVDEFMIVTGSAQTTRDLSFIERHLPPDKRTVTIDVTSMYAVFGVMGPRARDLLMCVSRADLSNTAFPPGTSKKIDLGYAMVQATRISYVGELGWELYVPVEFAVSVYEILIDAGRSHGLLDAGYYAIESLRIEKGYRAWGKELTPDYTPLEAGLSFAVKLGKEIDFRGREALIRQRQTGVSRRLAFFTLDDAETILWGDELILRDGIPAGRITSAAYGHALGCSVAMGYVSNPEGFVDTSFLRNGKYEIDVAGKLCDVSLHLHTPYDPGGCRGDHRFSSQSACATP